MTTPAFCTGSQVYGTPHEESDLDLVIYAPDEDTQRLLRLFATGAIARDVIHAPPYTSDGSFSLRFDRLNVMVCTSQAAYKAWRQGTGLLVDRTVAEDPQGGAVRFVPVTREEAVRVFDSCRAAYGLAPRPGVSSGDPIPPEHVK